MIKEVDSIEYVECISAEDMDFKEKYFIKTLNPKYNKKHNKESKFSFKIDESWKSYQINKNDSEVIIKTKLSKVLSIISPKGGVGRTSTAIHLGAFFAEAGKKTLLIDIDSNRNLSIGHRIEKTFEYSIKNFLDGDFNNFTLIQENENLFILSGDRNIENKKYTRDILSKHLKLLKQLDLDFIVLDCPSGLMNNEVGINEIALCASDFVLSPIEAEEYSIIGLEKLIPSINRIRSTYNRKLEFLGFFFNKVNVNTVNFKHWHDIAKRDTKEFLFNTFVRHDNTIEKSKMLDKNIFTCYPNSKATKDYIALSEEVMNKMKHLDVIK